MQAARNKSRARKEENAGSFALDSDDCVIRDGITAGLAGMTLSCPIRGDRRALLSLSDSLTAPAGVA